MGKSVLMKYLDRPTDIYRLVDDRFLDLFSEKHKLFMLVQYYNRYKKYCVEKTILPLPMDTFLKNASRRKIKLIQICCPYCGYIDLIIGDFKKVEMEHMRYCIKCGKKSTAEYIFLQLSAFLRLEEIHRAGINVLKNKYKPDEIRIISYDMYHMELIELTSILEKTLRDFFMDLSLLKYKHHHAPYIDNILKKSSGNDFMLWEKANDHYKKALDINLKEITSEECRKNLTDLVNIRNVIVHNNGMVDERFKTSLTYQRIGDIVSGDLIFLTEELIAKYLGSVLELVSAVEAEFNSFFMNEIHGVVANFYFNE